MKASWLIQTDMEGVDTRPLVNEVARQGMVVYLTQHRLGSQADFSDYSSQDCIICYGDIDFVRQVTTHAPFIPGAYCNFHNMKCSTYYAYFGEHLLNNNYWMMPVGDLLRRWYELITTFSRTGGITSRSLFIRPDSGAKPFTGYIVSPDEKDKIKTLVQTIGPETLIVVTPEKKITGEWRFVIRDRKIVTGCQYLPEELPLSLEFIRANLPSLFCLANLIASHEWQPDRCYTVDIAESEGKMHLLEINSLSCAGLYDCDIKSIVEHVSQSAVREWREYQ